MCLFGGNFALFPVEFGNSIRCNLSSFSCPARAAASALFTQGFYFAYCLSWLCPLTFGITRHRCAFPLRFLPQIFLTSPLPLFPPPHILPLEGRGIFPPARKGVTPCLHPISRSHTSPNTFPPMNPPSPPFRMSLFPCRRGSFSPF